jgi:prepilin-type N-terminal cleavage/methylation domain-containing protein
MNMFENRCELRVVSCELNAGSAPATLNTQLATPKRGFTLIEMITVLTIIIIVLAIAIPIWDALMNGTNLAAAQNQISAFVSNARADAIYNRRTIGVCFFIDPRTQQTAVAEVQVQTLYQAPYPGGVGAPKTYTSLFQPDVNGSYGPDNGPTNSLELVNNPDPTTPGNYIFYRDTTLLPKGVGVAFNNNTYTYNSNGLWLYPDPNKLPPLDRYVRIGAIMFNPDGSLASIPIGIPEYEHFTSAVAGTGTYNLLCQKIGMVSATDFGSNLTAPGAGKNPAYLPLMSSVGLVVYDHDKYLNQHATLQVANNSSSPPTQATIGDGAQFTDLDMDYSLVGASPPGGNSAFAQDKFIEESWIDQNGTAYLVSPFNGSLIKAK